MRGSNTVELGLSVVCEVVVPWEEGENDEPNAAAGMFWRRRREWWVGQFVGGWREERERKQRFCCKTKPLLLTAQSEQPRWRWER